jgi:YgiT-type zinc finger domain-containing protein
MQCEFCTGETQPKRVKRQHWLNGNLYIVENVEAEVCTECGERYFHARVLDAIDELLSRQHEVEKELRVEVVRFDQAAA